MNKITSTKFFAYTYINFVRIFKLTDFYQPTYNPHKKKLWPVKIDRTSNDRTNFMFKKLPKSVHSHLDIGSQLGYMNFIFAEKGISSYGLEMQPISWAYSQAVATMTKTENVAFMNSYVDASNVKNLPTFDVITYLNVYHHMVHLHGKKHADKVVRDLTKKCKYFVFECAEYGEEDQYWSKNLKFMGKEPKKWIENFLKDNDLLIIDKRNFKNHLNDRTRTMYITQRKFSG